MMASRVNILTSACVTKEDLNTCHISVFTGLICRYLVLLATNGAQVGFVAASADIAQFFGGLGWHGLGETQTAPGVSGRTNLGDYRLPLHG